MTTNTTNHKGECSSYVTTEREVVLKVRRYVKGVSDLDIEEGIAAALEDSPTMAGHGYELVEVLGVRDLL